MITKPTKYTEEFVLSELNDIIVELRSNPDIIFVGQLFMKRDYSRERFYEWARKYDKNHEISHTIKMINEILEVRAIERGVDLKGNSSFLIFFMKNKHGWKDRKDITSDDKAIQAGAIVQPNKLPDTNEDTLATDSGTN